MLPADAAAADAAAGTTLPLPLLLPLQAKFSDEKFDVAPLQLVAAATAPATKAAKAEATEAEAAEAAEEDATSL